jgi:hypothetical protein
MGERNVLQNVAACVKRSPFVREKEKNDRQISVIRLVVFFYSGY